MGYSCTARASYTMDAIQERFRHENSGNGFSADGGKTRFFHERGRENSDGAITGRVFQWLDGNTAKRAGGFRIEPDGTITQFRGIPKKFWKEMETKSEKRYNDTFVRT